MLLLLVLLVVLFKCWLLLLLFVSCFEGLPFVCPWFELIIAFAIDAANEAWDIPFGSGFDVDNLGDLKFTLLLSLFKLLSEHFDSLCFPGWDFGSNLSRNVQIQIFKLNQFRDETNFFFPWNSLIQNYADHKFISRNHLNKPNLIFVTLRFVDCVGDGKNFNETFQQIFIQIKWVAHSWKYKRHK